MSTKTTKPEQEQADIDLGQAYSRAELFLEKNKQAVTGSARHESSSWPASSNSCSSTRSSYATLMRQP